MSSSFQVVSYFNVLTINYGVTSNNRIRKLLDDKTSYFLDIHSNEKRVYNGIKYDLSYVNLKVANLLDYLIQRNC